MDENYNMIKEKYYRMLNRPEWFKRREEIIKRDNGCCRVCGSSSDLIVHHRQYHTIDGNPRKPWLYENKYLITLCRGCHTLGHKLFRVPRFNVKKKNCPGMSIPAEEFKRTKQYVKF